MMKQDIEALSDIMDREIEKNPHSGEIIGAFRPVLIAMIRFLAKGKLKSIPLTGFDPIRFTGGVSLVRQLQIFSPDDPWKEMVSEMSSAIKEGFPSLREDMERLEKAGRKGGLDIYDYFRTFPDHGEDIIKRWSVDLPAGPQGIALLLNQLTRIVLEKRRPDAVALIGDTEWKKGYCPVCGAFPTIALIEEKITRRWLHCSQCGHDWLFSRVICPYCEFEAQEGMDFFYVENRTQEAAFSCDKCQRYLVTLNRVSDLNDHELDVSALSLTHLDVIMQGKGLSPMVNCSWNTFEG
jgi:FdhE protein